MPELPDILAYLEALQTRVVGRPLVRVRITSPFLLRSVDPPIQAVQDRRVLGLRRLGKRIVIGLEDELFLILHRARLSPVRLTQGLTQEESTRLFQATHDTLSEWIERLGRLAKGGFPERVTAFRDGMAVHGRYGKPCPDCGSPVQRIVYADHETNYCARCQAGGRLLADRALSRLLKQDWPKILDGEGGAR